VTIAFTPRLDGRVASQCATRARVLAVIKRDNTLLRWTDHDSILTIDEGFGLSNYSPVGAPSFSARRKVAGLEPESIEIEGFFHTAGVTRDDIRARKFERAPAVLSTVDWMYPWAGAFDTQSFRLHDIAYSGEVWRATLKSLPAELTRLTGRTFNRRCDATLFDARCTVAETGKTATAAVTSVTGWSDAHPRQRFRSDLVWLDKRGKGGVLIWLTGANALANLSQYDVKLQFQANGEIELWTPTPFDIAVSDLFTIKEGCNKSFHGHCKKKHNNAVNHRGFTKLVTAKALLKGPDAGD
jgi:uncharacterized phage protein (TIGR02218 family)